VRGAKRAVNKRKARMVDGLLDDDVVLPCEVWFFEENEE
jgi:hypothetical protein